MASAILERHVSAPLPGLEMNSTLPRHGPFSSPGLPASAPTPASLKDRERRVPAIGLPRPFSKVVSRIHDQQGRPPTREAPLRSAFLPAPAGGSVTENFSGRRRGCGGFARAIE